MKKWDWERENHIELGMIENRKKKYRNRREKKLRVKKDREILFPKL